MDPDRDTHEHVLGPFGDLAIEFEEIGFLECFEAKVIEFKVAIVDEGCVEYVLVGHYDLVYLFADEGCGLVGDGVGVCLEG